ncbi:MAG: T9SS type A sorting domain-containing protein [Flavobacteriales bacterium]|nr:T9SS type A sorting domain-containing protein [Flavobacteriales bacterium]
MPTYARTHLKHNRTNAVLALWAMACLCFLALPRCEAQNLVPNPSFELTDTCPNTCCFNVGDRPLYWNRWDQSPDYFNACAGSLGGIDTLMDVPWNGWSWQYAYHGDAYVGMSCFEPGDFRELVGAPLIEPLVLGQTYYVSYRVNLATEGSHWEARWACNNQGVLFTMDEHIWSGQTGSGPEFTPRNYAHVNNPTIITDTANWTLVSGSFVADSAYRYIVLGNFFDDALTDTIHFTPGQPSLAAYYLYDAICVSPTPGECPTATGIQEAGREGVAVRVVGGVQWLQVDGAAAGSTAWVYDAGGRLMEQFALSGSSTRSIGQWPTGVYLLRVQGRTGSVWQGKFVVMR